MFPFILLNSSSALLATTLSVATMLFALSASVRSKVNDLVSAMIHVYLCWRYVIMSEDSGRTLPTCPYRWPNGQGDVGKFLNGVENSEIWEKRYGIIYRIWSGMTSEVVLTRPEQVQAVFKDSDKHIKAVNNNSGWLMGEVLGKCVGLVSQGEWKTVRSVTEVPFLHKNVLTYTADIEQRTADYLNRLVNSGRLGSGLIHPVEDFKLLPFFTIADVIYGKLTPRMETQLKDMIPNRESLFSYLIAGGLTRYQWSKYLPTEANRSLTTFKAAWRSFNDSAYQSALSSHSNAPIIQMYDAMKSGKVSKEQLYQTLDEILFANLDVTMGGLSWNLLFLASHQNTQDKLRAEISSQRSTSKQDLTAWDRYLQSSSTLLAACVFESSRLKPLAAFSVPQAAPTERAVGDFMIPAKTNYVVDSYALNLRNPYWGDDASTYRPERFLERRPTEARYNFWRFGFGPRTCMGKYIADLIIRDLIVHLVEDYKLSLEEHDKNWERNKEVWITHPNSEIRCEKLAQQIN